MNFALTLKKPYRDKQTEEWIGEYKWIQLAIDRNKNKIIDFEIGDRSRTTYIALALRLQKKV